MIFDFSMLNDSSMDYIDQIVDRYKEVVIPFYTNPRTQYHNVNGFGSGFVVKHKGSYFVVTAKHVMSDVKKYGMAITVFGKRKMILENIRVVSSKDRDVAVFCIDKWMENERIQELPHITFYEDYSFQSVEDNSYFILMGYPATKNRVRDYRKGLNPNLLSITVIQTTPPEKLRSDAKSPIFYEFDSKKLIDSSCKKISCPPDLYGMSGGPAFELVARRPILMRSNTKIEFSLRFCGVLIEWHKAKKCILSSMKDVAESLVDRSLEEEKTNTKVGDMRL